MPPKRRIFAVNVWVLMKDAFIELRSFFPRFLIILIVWPLILVPQRFISAGGVQPRGPGLVGEWKAQKQQGGDLNLFTLPLEELLKLEVVSSARRPQQITRASSAMYVITAEDIRQAGVSRLSDLFRWVPGMEVAHRRAHESALSARGFARPASQRMQILLDGRPLYDGFKGGMDLSYHPIFLENIERIEVIRGAAGVIWGSNAVNGVINIITKKAADTQGGFIYGGFGNRALQQGHLRFGGTSGNMAWRSSVGAFHDNGFGSNRGNDIKDYSQGFQSTGRVDLNLDADTQLNIFGGHKNTTNGYFERHISQQYMNLIWARQLEDDSQLQIQLTENFLRWYDRVNRLHTNKTMLEIQHSFNAENHNVVWGADYIRDKFSIRSRGDHQRDATPDNFVNNQVSFFVDDEITLADDLWLTLGTRLNYNELTYFDWAGRTALVWEMVPEHFIRAAVSRSFRMPIMHEEFADVVINNNNSFRGNRNLDNEELLAYELGYRGLLAENLKLNIEGFLNRHKNLIGLVDDSSGLYNQIKQNIYNVKTYGIETAIDYKPRPWWLCRLAHSYEHQTDENRFNNSAIGRLVSFTVPKHKLALTNRFYLDNSTTINTALFWSDKYYNFRKAGRIKIDPYLRFDVRLGKKIWNDSAEIAFGVTNLTDHFHIEGGEHANQVPRQFYIQFFYRF
ncbi:MAG: TonB-dependent receptor plug domain-containing protein [Planctomycetota bacterium]|jgi:iron complex outermembrane receptor protein